MSAGDAAPQSGDRPRSADGGVQAEIARAITGAFREATGRGPRVIQVHPSEAVVTAVVFGSLTRLEETLIANGFHATVIASREAAIATRRDELAATVERVTQRRVVSMHCDLQPEPDISVLNFVLARPASETPAA